MSDNSRSWLSRLLRRSGADASAADGLCIDPATGEEVDCRGVRSRASDYIDGESSQSLTERIKVHLGICDDCDGWVKTLTTTVGLTRDLPREEVPESLRQKIRDISSGSN